VTIGAVLLGIILAGVGLAESKPPVKIFGLSGISGLAMVKLIEEPLIGGKTVTHSILKSPDLLMGKLITGEVDLAALPINTAAILYNKGVSIQVAAVIGWGALYLVGDLEIKDWNDLKGKKVLVPAKGAAPDLLLRYLLLKNGLNPERDMTIQYVGSPIELARLSAAGEAPLAVLPEPWVTEVITRNSKNEILLDFQSEWQKIENQGQTYPQTCIAVNKGFAGSNPEFVRRYLKELDQAIRWLNENPEPAGILAEKYVHITANAIQKGLPRCNVRFEPALKARGKIERFLSRLAEIEPKVIGEKMPDEGFYYQP
jgi:NitT/TauT family transport system substrate-binding protein